jgi:ribose-phosphate pyrophosphokinase
MISVFTKTSEVPVKWWTFPGGERACKIEGLLDSDVLVRVDFRGSDDVVDMMLIVNAIRSTYYDIEIDALIPYFPGARQDRVMTEGEPFALQVFAQTVKLCRFRHVEVWDPHSDVLGGLFEAGHVRIVPQWTFFAFIGEDKSQAKNTYLVSPDAGALKKIYKLAQKTGLPVIEASKVRDGATGAVVATHVETNPRAVGAVRLCVVDDIIDGGRTFIELATALRQTYSVEHLSLLATHGLFSKGLEVLACYDEIIVINNMSNYDLRLFNNRKRGEIDSV